MNYCEFINQQVINKDNEVGTIIAFNNSGVTVKYQNCEKIYNPDIAFKTGFLTFCDEEKQKLITQDVSNKENIEKEKEKQIQDNQRQYLARRKKVNETYKRLYQKNRVLQALFGDDFIYPPFHEFVKKYDSLIDKRTWVDRLFSGYLHDTHYHKKYWDRDGTLLLS